MEEERKEEMKNKIELINQAIDAIIELEGTVYSRMPQELRIALGQLNRKRAIEEAETNTTVGTLRELLEAWDEHFGEKSCDCRHEPENAGHVCPQCKARAVLKQDEPKPEPAIINKGMWAGAKFHAVKNRP